MLEDDKVAEVYLERPERRSIAGNIYLGQVDNVLPGMEAAFVEIGLEKNGFLYVDEIVGPEIERGHGRKIQDLISKGQTILVQAVKDPMKTKGARLTTQISLPGRFVVFVPQGEGLGVSRRLDDDERTRLKDILKKLSVKEGGMIVRTAAEGASEEDIERDLVFLQRALEVDRGEGEGRRSAPELDLPGGGAAAARHARPLHRRLREGLRRQRPGVQAHHRLPEEDVAAHGRARRPLQGDDAADGGTSASSRRSSRRCSRRVDLPSGGYLIFDYAEAFTVIDVNTGRFVGSRGKNSGGRLEDTITKNNLEAVKEVVRQLRLRDIGGIIVIDFIDMANPKNRATVEEALRTELERDRTKTYVVEISPLGLVEMTRQNVTDGPREIMTRKCPTCGGDGIVYSEASAAIDVERRLAVARRRLALAGVPGRARRADRRGARRPRRGAAPGARGDDEAALLPRRQAGHASRPLRRARRGQARRPRAGGAGRGGRRAARRARRGRPPRRLGRRRQGRRLRRLRRRSRRRSSARRSRCASSACSTAPRTRRSCARRGKKPPEPLTAEAEAEKPTRKPPARKDGRERRRGRQEAGDEAARRADAEGRGGRRRGGGGARAGRGRPSTPDASADAATRRADGAATAPAKKKTRRGSRGGKNRKKPATRRAASRGRRGETPTEAAERDTRGDAGRSRRPAAPSGSARRGR